MTAAWVLISPAARAEGTVTVTAKDKYGATASITVPVNVMDTGDAKLSPTNVTWTRGQGQPHFHC